LKRYQLGGDVLPGDVGEGLPAKQGLKLKRGGFCPGYLPVGEGLPAKQGLKHIGKNDPTPPRCPLARVFQQNKD